MGREGWPRVTSDSPRPCPQGPRGPQRSFAVFPPSLGATELGRQTQTREAGERSGDVATQLPTGNGRADACGRECVCGFISFAIAAIRLQPRPVKGLSDLAGRGLPLARSWGHRRRSLGALSISAEDQS